MRVEYKLDEQDTRDADLSRIGNHLVVIDGSIVHRITLTSEQWLLLSKSARHAAEGK